MRLPTHDELHLLLDVLRLARAVAKIVSIMRERRLTPRPADTPAAAATGPPDPPRRAQRPFR